MNTTPEQNIFHPYKIISQTRGSLQLKPALGQKTILLVLRIMPLIMLTIGLVVYITQKEILFLAVFGGIALIEAFIFSFVKIPASLSMDNIGFTLETLSIKGRKEIYHLWNDVDYIRHRVIQSKNSTSLSYEAVLKEGKKISFLNFGSYHAKKSLLPEINAILSGISRKEVRDK